VGWGWHVSSLECLFGVGRFCWLGTRPRVPASQLLVNNLVSHASSTSSTSHLQYNSHDHLFIAIIDSPHHRGTQTQKDVPNRRSRLGGDHKKGEEGNVEGGGPRNEAVESYEER